MILVFEPKRLSRSTTRQQWQEIWRWKRLIEQRLKKSIEEQVALLSIYSSSMPATIREERIDVIVNPPIFIYPSLPPQFQDVDLRPGGVYYIK